MKKTFIFSLILSLSFIACSNDMTYDTPAIPPPLKPGKILDPDSEYAKKWSGKPTLAKLKDNLILSIPPQHLKFWLQQHWLTGHDLVARPPIAIDKIPLVPSSGFVMFTPDFGGYTPDNYMKEFDENDVLVFNIQPASMDALEPGAPGAYPPNGLARTIQYKGIADPNKFETKYGLICYERKEGDGDQQICYGKRESTLDEHLMLHITTPPYNRSTLFPIMQTTYFSPRYGGLNIGWRSHMKNFSQWREIDAQIWKYIDAWNIVPQKIKATSKN